MHRYKIKWVWGHYEVYRDGSFLCSADTEEEARRDIEEMEDLE